MIKVIIKTVAASTDEQKLIPSKYKTVTTIKLIGVTVYESINYNP